MGEKKLPPSCGWKWQQPAAGQPGRATADLVQTVLSLSVTIELVGEAVRLDYRIPCSKLRTVGGVTPILSHREFQEGPIAAVDDTLIYGATWHLEYILPTSPQGNLPVAGSPALGVASQDDD